MELEKSRFILDFEKPIKELEDHLQSLKATSEISKVDVSKEIQAIEKKIKATKHAIYSSLTTWQRIQIARHPQRPYALDYIKVLFEDFQPLSGDRLFREDKAIIGGPAFFNKKPVMVLGTQKGRGTQEKIRCNFGSPNPEGYRKAIRLMEMAHNFNMPIIALIDTPGAYPGIGAEERHVAEAIAVNLRKMIRLNVPIIAVIIGEGGSGGALGVAVADKVMILENAYYSVISPEGCAAILWKHKSHAPAAAEALNIHAQALLKLGIVDNIIPEPLGGAHRDWEKASLSLKFALEESLRELEMDSLPLLEKRYQKYRNFGVFQESLQTRAANDSL